MRLSLPVRLSALFMLLGACAAPMGAASAPLAEAAQAPPAAGTTGTVPVLGYEIVRTFPHATDAFTEGLFYRGEGAEAELVESTGRFPSDIRIVRLADGEVLRKRVLDTAYFGEGIVQVGDRLISLTWRNHLGFIWNATDLSPMGLFSYTGEGWALTKDDHRIIMSDGTPALRFLDPQTLAVTGRLTVTADGRPVDQLNELEWVADADAPGGGYIYANIWQTDRIARIDPTNGHVVAWIDLTGLFPESERKDVNDDVLNGIAWDAAGKRLFVTGKNWPQLFEIRIK
ncbi:glutaminyl-peptide cyclotransferase [Brevundimonas goettingensis]|uniref:Glutaminyl-peptide cyclotransferase n=1 Tax=Brevundimonas goettingensis TaxID=2774190 RepID=A0A975GV15_9CAUL|nr:glutaminyl-peptide cyclotransferase [Brevundimonas goettingensis]QTC90896.1 glutaminyl-peptide cyclotransferase [Brevundimonas goettingensis]